MTITTTGTHTFPPYQYRDDSRDPTTGEFTAAHQTWLTTVQQANAMQPHDKAARLLNIQCYVARIEAAAKAMKASVALEGAALAESLGQDITAHNAGKTTNYGVHSVVPRRTVDFKVNDQAAFVACIEKFGDLATLLSNGKGTSKRDAWIVKYRNKTGQLPDGVIENPKKLTITIK